jgi:hypothetical protein
MMPSPLHPVSAETAQTDNAGLTFSVFTRPGLLNFFHHIYQDEGIYKGINRDITNILFETFSRLTDRATSLL